MSRLGPSRGPVITERIETAVKVINRCGDKKPTE